ncbi:MAG: hypothetical protein ACI85O_003418 [Saprospiraceae bacterium]|jgi:hypothetical protein
MTKFLTLLVAVSFIFTQDLSAQKIKNERISFEYTRLPSNPLDPTFTTYSSVVYGSDYGLENLGIDRNGAAEKYFTLGGFKRVGKGGHFRVSCYVGYPSTTSAETKSYTKTITNKDKTKTKVTRYKKEVAYRVPVRYKIEDYQGNVITSGSMNEIKTFTFGESATSSSSLSTQWRNSRGKLMTDKYKKAVRDGFSSASGTIRSLYGYSRRKQTAQIEVLGKKDKGTEEFMSSYETVKAAFAGMRAEEKTDKVKEEARPAIEFYMAEKKKWAATDKKERKVRSACVYNLATIFYWLDELDEARKYANECVEIDYKPGRGKSLIRSIDATKKLFDVNNTTSRHPSLDMSNAVAPGMASFGGLDVVEEGAAAVGAAAKALTGSIVDKNGDTVPGEFMVSAADGEELKFGPQGNVSFDYMQDGRKASGALAPADIKEFTLSERNFMVMDFVPGAKGNTESKMAIMELLYDGGSIKVLKYYPYDDALGDQSIEYAFHKTGDGAPTSTSSTMFLLFNKGLQKYFVDCADLAEVAGTGEFKKTEDDIIRAARVYAEMCKAP